MKKYYRVLKAVGYSVCSFSVVMLYITYLLRRSIERMGDGIVLTVLTIPFMVFVSCMSFILMSLMTIRVIYTKTSTTSTRTLISSPVAPSLPSLPLTERISSTDIWGRLKNELSILVVSPSGRGKTTLGKELLALRDEEVIVLDPHGYDGKWGNFETVGCGRDFKAVEMAVAHIYSEMTRRYSHLDEEHFSMTVLIDELTALVSNADNKKLLGTQLQSLLIEGRKVGMRLIMLAHSDRVGALGMNGKGDLLDGVLTVRLPKIGVMEIDEHPYEWEPSCMIEQA